MQSIDLKAEQIRTKPLEMFREAKQAVDLTQAPILVAVGRGINAPENIPIAEKLARLLGGELAASRPICDEGWLPMDRQIGSSGQTVAPKLYVALGISGAIQHVVGMKGSRTIVAINKAQNAPIFEISDYGIVGDLFEIVPAPSSNNLRRMHLRNIRRASIYDRHSGATYRLQVGIPDFISISTQKSFFAPRSPSRGPLGLQPQIHRSLCTLSC